nr:MAG TPA: hypothetical protein [Caudoviricetes sp.]
MDKKELGQILRKHYGAKSSMVKKVRAGINKPSYEMMVKFDDDGVPFRAWMDIKAWLAKQTKKEAKNDSR